MPTKKTAKKTRNKKLGIDPTLKPKVIDTSHMASKEEQEDNPLNRSKLGMTWRSEEWESKELPWTKPVSDMTKDAPLPPGFKTADSITEKDDLEFENGKLREMLVSWLDKKVVDGIAYQVMVDPLNREVIITRE
jgi:hypothetical protein